MSKYDGLDARSKLEQTVAGDLERAFEKRGFEIHHNGTESTNAPGGLPDIEAWDDRHHINVEVTKTTRAGADREYLAIKDHLDRSKQSHPGKKCFVWYVSPETHYRMINAIREHNITRKDVSDLKIMPLTFSSFELLINKFIESTKDEVRKEQILSLFSEYLQFVDDERVLKVLHDKLFPQDADLKREIEMREENKHQKTIEDLISDLTKLEQDLRDYRIALATDAIRNVILLVFIKLYEEKREHAGEVNRLTKDSFIRFQDIVQQRRKKRAIQ